MATAHRLATALVVCAVARLWGQTLPEKDEIVTDRPDITEASTVVPKDSLQVENGVAWTADHDTRTLDLTQSLVRLVFPGVQNCALACPIFSQATVFGQAPASATSLWE